MMSGTNSFFIRGPQTTSDRVPEELASGIRRERQAKLVESNLLNLTEVSPPDLDIQRTCQSS